MRLFVAAAITCGAALADLPTTYRVALIQVSYTGAPAAYSKLQLLTAAEELKQYYTQISNFHLNLEVEVSSFDAGGSRDSFIGIDSAGNSYPIPDHETLAAKLADKAAANDHIDFSSIDGIAILSSFCAGDYSHGRVTISGVAVAATFELSYLFENCGRNPSLTPPGPSRAYWGGWAHEFGHMISTHAGYWAGHPSGYASGYALMDSCYPSSTSAYSVLGTAFMTGDKRMFNGWLPDFAVITAASPAPSTTTVPLRALSLTPYILFCPTCNQFQVIKVPITDGLYYLVEARQRTGVDALPTTLSHGGLWDEGVHITRVDESADPPVQVINSCDTLVAGGCDKGLSDPRHSSCNGPQGYSVDTYPSYCWPCPLFHVGDTYYGQGGIQISVLGVTSDGYNVNVQRNPSPGFPDVRVAPRPPLPAIPGFNVSGVGKHQIWIDSSCNGYVTDIGPAALRFGDPAQAQSFAAGDDLCLGHENRLYGRIENRGTALAQGVRVHFDLGDPAADAGACQLQQNCSRFVEIGVADAQRFPALASLAPGARASVYVAYTPPAIEQGARFTTPALRVRIDAVPGELSTGDNVAEAAFGRVQAVVGRFGSTQVSAPDFVYTSPVNAPTVFRSQAGAFPAGISVSTGLAPERVTLAAGQSLRTPVTFSVSGQTQPAAGRYAANLMLSAFETLSNPMHADVHVHLETIAMRTIGVDVVQPSGIDLRAGWNGNAQSTIEVHGQLQPGLHGAVIALDYTARNGAPATLLVQTNGNGEFEAHLPAAAGSTVGALWSGDDQHGPAISGPIIPK